MSKIRIVPKQLLDDKNYCHTGTSLKWTPEFGHLLKM
jgi:hypothetical protein